MIVELRDQASAETVRRAIDAYRMRLVANIERTRRRLAAFESRHGFDTARFLAEMTAEDLPEGDLEYVAWAGEAELLQGLEAELAELDDARDHIR
jgi:hypothetical protein